MNLVIRFCLLLMLTNAILTSCKKPVPKIARYIPKDASTVITINTKALHNKLGKNEHDLQDFFKSLQGPDTLENNSRGEWEEFKSSGIDLSEKIFIMNVKSGDAVAPNASNIIAGIAAIKDATKLEAYIKKKRPLDEVTKEKDYSYTTWHGENIVAWNDDAVIFMRNQQSYNGGMEYDSITHTFNLRRPGSTNNLKAEIDTYFKLKEDESIASIQQFKDLMQDQSDATLWINLATALPAEPIQLPTAKALLTNSYTTGALNFEDGKIDIKTKSYFSNELSDIFKKYTGPVVNLDLINNYPSENINGFAVCSFDLEVITAIVRALQIGGVTDNFLTKTMGSDYTLQNAVKVLKGDVAIIVSDFKLIPSNTVKKTTDDQHLIETFDNGNLLLTAPVNDRTELNKLVNILVQNKVLVKVNDQYKLVETLRMTGMQLSIDDKNILLANDSVVLMQYKTKGGKAKFSNDIMNDLKGKSAAAYINFESVLKGIPAQRNDSIIGMILPKAKETFKDAEAYTNNFNGKFVEGHAVIRFKNEKQNSLASLLQFASTVSQASKKKHDEVMENGDIKRPFKQ